MKRSLLPCALLLMAVILLLCPGALASDKAEPVQLTVTAKGHPEPEILNDGNTMYYRPSYRNFVLTLESQQPFCSLYIMYDREFGEYTITNNTTGESITAGQYQYLHEYIPLPWAATSVTITYPKKAISISEITAYTAGTPEGIQIWEPPLDGEADLLLLSAHGDDDQLFFAGLLPLYGAELGYKVQVAYLTDHRTLTMERTHEMLNGLWEVGIRHYPVFGGFHDFRKDSLLATYQEYAERNVSRQTLLKFVVTQLRRFKPQVVVTHDFEGEYGHGMHRAYADLLAEAVTISNDETKFKDVAKQYGLWEVSKAYFHLYEENPIVMDYDTPLRSFDGMTAFNVSRLIGFPCHESQLRDTDFALWINGENGEIEKATQIEEDNPCYFGLYFSTVGEDVAKNDFMENTPGYFARQRVNEAQDARAAAAAAESQRLQQRDETLEEKARQDAEAKRLEEKRLKDEQAAMEEDRRRLTMGIAVITIVVVLSLLSVMLKKLLTPTKPRFDPNEPLPEYTEPAEEANPDPASEENATETPSETTTGDPEK